MIKNRQETIAYIIKEARGVFDELLKHGYKVVSVDRMADIIDRIEAAWKREREAGAEAAQICGEIGEMIGREAACKQSVTNCNHFGNAEKMRAALEKADAVLSLISKSAWFIDANFSVNKAVIEAVNAIEAALSAPPRNCDVGTPEDQHNRFMRFCDSKSMGYCWGRGCRKCMAQWGQIPYEGENEEIKK